MATVNFPFTSMDKWRSLERLCEEELMKPPCPRITPNDPMPVSRDVPFWNDEHQLYNCPALQSALDKSREAWFRTYHLQSERETKKIYDNIARGKNVYIAGPSTIVDVGSSGGFGVLGRNRPPIVEEPGRRKADQAAVRILKKAIDPEIEWMQKRCDEANEIIAYNAIPEAERSELQYVVDRLTRLIHDSIQLIDMPTIE